MSYGRVNYEYNGIPIGDLPVREGVARGRILGKMELELVIKYSGSSEKPKYHSERFDK